MSSLYQLIHGLKIGQAIGQAMTDHMNFSLERGWPVPEIRPYGPLDMDPACSCFHYCPNVFEGLKVRRWLPTRVPTDQRSINILTRLRLTGISRTGWHPAFVPAATEHGTDGSLRRTRRPSRTHLPHALPFHHYSNADTQHSTRRPASLAPRRRRSLNAHQTPCRARRARLHPTHDNRYTTLARRLGLTPRSTSPRWAVHPRHRRPRRQQQQRQGKRHLAARD